MQEIDIDTITALLEEPREDSKQKVNQQKGPLKLYDIEMRCASRRCNSPTYVKIDGIPYCMMHALIDLNGIVLRLEERLRGRNIGSTGTGSTTSTASTAETDT